MSDSNVTNRIAALETLVVVQQAKLRRGLKLSLIIYIILAVIVAAYTSVAISALKDLTSDQALAEHAGALLQQIPVKRQEIISQYDANADQWAKDLVKRVVGQTGQVEEAGRQLLDAAADRVADEVKNTIRPQFSKSLQEIAPDVKETLKGLEEKDAAEGLVLVFMEVINKEMDEYINDRFVDGINSLQKDLDLLARPDAKLNRKQDAERRFIQY